MFHRMDIFKPYLIGFIFSYRNIDYYVKIKADLYLSYLYMIFNDYEVDLDLYIANR